MNQAQAYRWGIFCALVNVIAWGSSHISGRWLMSGQYIDLISLGAIRYTAGGLILLGLGLIFHRKKLLAVTPRDLLVLSGLGALGIVIHTSLLLLGQSHTTAINSSLIYSLNPVMVLILGIFWGHKIDKVKTVGILLSLCGCLLVIGVINENGFNYNSDHLYGDMIILISSACWALYILLSTKTVNRLGGFTATTWSMLSAAVQFLLIQISWPLETHLPSSGETNQWLVVLYVVLVPTAAGFFFWYEAMARIELSLLNVMQYLTPVATIVLAYFILSERMTLLNIIGAILTMAGIIAATKIIKRGGAK
ncbi:MAG: DMT family transporter [Planctomycetota bacterium]|jgi:drug/metabolite transporter (DMT)-like permease